ncbi:MAG: hypothetical protein AAFN07_14865 [Pseudomonadota bacterium]
MTNTKTQPLSNKVFFATLAEVVLDFGVLLFAALMSVLATFGLMALSSFALMVPGLIVLLVSTSAVIKYAAIVSRAIAFGLPIPSAPGSVLEHFSELWAFLPWLAMLLYTGVLVAIAESVSVVAASFIAVLLIPLVPAAVGAIIVNRSIAPMFRVAGLIHIIRVTGVDYLKVLLVWLTLGALAWWLRGEVSGMTSAFLAVLVGTLQVFALFAACGIVLFHHHRALGLPVRRDTKEARQQANAAKEQERERRAVLDQAYGFFSRENSVGGLQRIKSYVDTHPEDSDAIEWFLGRMQTWEQLTPALMLARNYITLLLASGDTTRDAVRVLRWCLKTDQRFMPHESDRQRAAELLEPYPEFERAKRWPGVTAV